MYAVLQRKEHHCLVACSLARRNVQSDKKYRAHRQQIDQIITTQAAPTNPSCMPWPSRPPLSIYNIILGVEAAEGGKVQDSLGITIDKFAKAWCQCSCENFLQYFTSTLPYPLWWAPIDTGVGGHKAKSSGMLQLKSFLGVTYEYGYYGWRQWWHSSHKYVRSWRNVDCRL